MNNIETISIDIDSDIKTQASDLAKKMWSNLDIVVNHLLLNFVKNKQDTNSFRDYEWFTKEASEDLLKAWEDAKKGIWITGVYDNFDDLFKHLYNIKNN